jgi:hypothetical protein
LGIIQLSFSYIFQGFFISLKGGFPLEDLKMTFGTSLITLPKAQWSRNAKYEYKFNIFSSKPFFLPTFFLKFRDRVTKNVFGISLEPLRLEKH